MPKERQVTLSEQIEAETGVPVPEDTIPIELPKRHRTKPGFVSKFIHIPEDKYALIKKYIEANDLDEGRFLTRQLSNIADELK